MAEKVGETPPTMEERFASFLYDLHVLDQSFGIITLGERLPPKTSLLLFRGLLIPYCLEATYTILAMKKRHYWQLNQAPSGRIGQRSFWTINSPEILSVRTSQLGRDFGLQAEFFTAGNEVYSGLPGGDEVVEMNGLDDDDLEMLEAKENRLLLFQKWQKSEGEGYCLLAGFFTKVSLWDIADFLGR